jgi:hypothetical protein
MRGFLLLTSGASFIPYSVGAANDVAVNAAAGQASKLPSSSKRSTPVGAMAPAPPLETIDALGAEMATPSYSLENTVKAVLKTLPSASAGKEKCDARSMYRVPGCPYLHP